MEQRSRLTVIEHSLCQRQGPFSFLHSLEDLLGLIRSCQTHQACNRDSEPLNGVYDYVLFEHLTQAEHDLQLSKSPCYDFIMSNFASPPGRSEPLKVGNTHFVNGTSIRPPFSKMAQVLLGMGCFWGAERRFWETAGVHTTAVGYAGGTTQNPTYEEVCTGITGHNEVVLVVFDPLKIEFSKLLQVFWEAHDPTQGMRQGADRGTQYRSGIYTTSPVQHQQAVASRALYQQALQEAGRGKITTEIIDAPSFYYAEQYHQQYLAKNPGGYCGLGGTGVSCPLPVA